MGILYLVPTPIGNLEDMTFRAVNVLKSVAIIAAEDTRTTKKLLNAYEIDSKMLAYHEHNKEQVGRQIVRELGDGDVALVSDAGTPGISDPGFELVNQALAAGVEVVALPGATAFVPALVASGLPTDKFVFLGFLPKKKNARNKVWEEIRQDGKTLIFYESPYRLGEFLREAFDELGDRQACVAREVSKKYETYYRSRLVNLVEELADEKLPGEVVVIVSGASKSEGVWSEEKVREEIARLLEAGEGVLTTSKELVQVSGWRKKQIYEIALEIKKSHEA